MLRLTRTGKIFLAVIVVMQFASITSQSGLLIWPVGLIIGCFLVNTIGSIRSVRKIRLRAHHRILMEAGAPPREPWQLANIGKRRARLVTIECKDRVWLSCAGVPPRETVSIHPRNVFTKRGVYSLADAWIVSLYPFGLVKAMRETESDAEILVFPKLYPADVPEVRGLDPMLGGRQTGPGRIATGEKFAGVRPLQPGDSYKQIHWKSSAKGSGLMTKAFEEELAGRASLIIWCDANSPHAEACIRAAGSIAHAGIEAGHQVDFQNLNNCRRVRVQPFGETSTLLEELARYDTSSGTLTKKSIDEAALSIARRSALHFVCTNVPPIFAAKISELNAAGKLVILHVPAGSRITADCAIRHYPLE